MVAPLGRTWEGQEKEGSTGILEVEDASEEIRVRGTGLLDGQAISI